MVKILLDTDIGGDIDDAVCLAYLLTHPQCELVGITTVTGEASKRAALASVLCKVAGRDVPIYPGSELPMTGEQRQKVAEQAAALPRWDHDTDFPQGQAIEFMRRTIRTHPDEVILLTIGPLTNVGQLFTADPEIAHLLKGLVIMGGIFTELPPDPERIDWNLIVDPKAAEIVYQTPVRLHRSVGLDVTERLIIPAEEVRQRFTAPLLRPVLDFGEIWFAEFAPHIVFHDPLAAATVFEPELCHYWQGQVALDRTGTTRVTSFTPAGPAAPHQVAVAVDQQRYFEHFFSVFNVDATDSTRAGHSPAR